MKIGRRHADTGRRTRPIQRFASTAYAELRLIAPNYAESVWGGALPVSGQYRVPQQPVPFGSAGKQAPKAVLLHPNQTCASRSLPSRVLAQVLHLGYDWQTMLNTKTIRERLHQSPFTPFRICLADGQRIAVQHPDFVALGGSVVLVTDRQDNIQRLESLHIASLDDIRP